MTDQKSLEQQLKEKQIEIDQLKKKLADRNPAFNGNLIKRSEQKLDELCQTVGKLIQQALGQDYTYAFKNKKFTLDYDSGFSSGKGWVIYICDEKDRKDIADKIADQEMKKFQESIDNFAWAVQNQGGG